jgi:hypothetical protein
VGHRMRSGADETHLAFEYIQNLRQFVQRCAAQERAQRGDAADLRGCLGDLRSIFRIPSCCGTYGPISPLHSVRSIAA